MEPRLEVDGFFVVYVGVRWPSEAGVEWALCSIGVKGDGWRPSGEPRYKLNGFFLSCT